MYYFLVSLVSPSDHVNNVYLRMDTQPVLNIMAAVNTTADFLSGESPHSLCSVNKVYVLRSDVFI